MALESKVIEIAKTKQCSITGYGLNGRIAGVNLIMDGERIIAAQPVSKWGVEGKPHPDSPEGKELRKQRQAEYAKRQGKK